MHIVPCIFAFPVAFRFFNYAGKPRPPICSMPTLQKKYNENLIPELNRFGRNLMARPCLNLTFLLRQKNRGENPQR
jgi:hypothetical protein